MSQQGFLRGRPFVKLNQRLENVFFTAVNWSDAMESGDSEARNVALSIKILLWSIRNALKTYLPSRNKIWRFARAQSQLLRSRMLQSGKCPCWTEIYLRTYSIAMIYYLSATPTLAGNANHEQCSANSRCTAHDVDEDLYVTSYVTGNCNCNIAGPDIRQVVSILESGGLPLMSFQALPSGDLALDVVQAKYGLHYTAISHVWSAGLGNPSSNTLPQCQLQ